MGRLLSDVVSGVCLEVIEPVKKHEECEALLKGCMLQEHKGYPPCNGFCQWIEDNPIRDLTLEANELYDLADKADSLGETMTDLEITKLCAEAMGLEVPSWSVKATVLTVYDSAGVLSRYDPMHDDTQAMALVKKFKLNIRPADWLPRWHWRVGNELTIQPMSINTDLNRAICECVAKMQAAKNV